MSTQLESRDPGKDTVTTPITIAAVVGSLRAESFSRATFRAATRLCPDIEWIEADISDVPLYNQDVEDAGDAVAALKETVEVANALVFFTPEYNRSIPAVTKNAVDWLSRPYGRATISGRTVGIVATVPGGHLGEGVRRHLTDSVSALTDGVFDPSIAINSVTHRMHDGEITDEEALTDLGTWLTDFAEYVRDRDS
jgi:chromate reductase